MIIQPVQPIQPVLYPTEFFYNQKSNNLASQVKSAEIDDKVHRLNDTFEDSMREFKFKESVTNEPKAKEIRKLVELGTQRFTNIMHARYINNL